MMKKELIKKLGIIISLILLAGSAVAAEMDHSGHDMQQNKGEKLFHKSMVDGYHFKYKLIDMREKLKKMKNAEHIKATHHLMVYVSMMHGDHEMAVTEGKVGYLLVTPDGTKSTAMAMGMGGGFGADINLAKKGDYTIKTKVVAGGKKLIDSFNHTVK